MIPAPELELRAALPLILIAVGAFAVLVADLLLSPRGGKGSVRSPAFTSAVLCGLSVATLAEVLVMTKS